MNLADIQRLARQTMDEHGLADWTLKMGRAKTYAGWCDWSTHTIRLSAAILPAWSEADVLDVILHEVAHALTQSGHDEAWKDACRRIGARPERCYDRDTLPTPAHKWRGTCPACGKVSLRHRRGKTSCGKCSDVFDERFLLVWTLAA